MQPQLTTARQGLTPLRAFAVVATLALLTGTALYFSTPDIAQEPTPNPLPAVLSPSPTVVDPPSEAEARSIFEALDKKRVAAYEAPSEADITDFLGADSPLRKPGKKEFSQLRRQEIHVSAQTRSNDVTILKTTKYSLVVKQVIERRLRFLTSDGEDVSRSSRWERRSIRWTLRHYPEGWKIYNSKLLSAKKI